MNVKKIIKTVTSITAGASIIDALVKNGRKLIDKNCEKIVIFWSWVDHSNYLDRVIPIMEYLYKYDKDVYRNFNVFAMQLENCRFNRKNKIRKETFDKMMYAPSDGVKVVRITKKDAVILTFQSTGKNDDRYENTAGSLTIQIIGPNRKKIKKKLESIALSNGVLDSYTRSEESGWIRLDRNMSRTINTVYSHQKPSILAAIENHAKRAEAYKAIGKKNKFVMLLYGEPGTGKSSMIEALANHYNRHLRIFGPEVSETTLVNTVTNGEFAIYVLEEVDLFFEAVSDKKSMSGDKSDSGNKNPEGKLSVLLQILDGLYTRENMFFIMTTNHIEKLDKRLTRDGRIDLMIEMTGIDETLAKIYCADMGLTAEECNEVLFELDKDVPSAHVYNQAKLEKAVLAYIQ